MKINQYTLQENPGFTSELSMPQGAEIVDVAWIAARIVLYAQCDLSKGTKLRQFFVSDGDHETGCGHKFVGAVHNGQIESRYIYELIDQSG